MNNILLNVIISMFEYICIKNEVIEIKPNYDYFLYDFDTDTVRPLYE